MQFLRTHGFTAGMFLLLVAVFCTTLAIVPSEAEAGCSTTTVIRSGGGRSSSSSVSRCSAPRARICRFQNRCTPQRTCTSRSNGRSSSSFCSTRDVCKRVEICS
ncbi:MAG: hypothetical protein ABI867_40190 [Kofleriaceae bacterium]